MGDIDILIPEKSIIKASYLLGDIGYSPEISILRHLLTRDISYELNFDGGLRIPVHLEIHWDLIGGKESIFYSDINWFWNNSILLSNDCPQIENASVINPSAQILYLSAHLLYKHRGKRTRLVWFYDIYRLINDSIDEINWEAIINNAQLFCWDFAVYKTVLQLSNHFGLKFNKEVIQKLDINNRDVYKYPDHFNTKVEKAIMELKSFGCRGSYYC